MLSQAKDVFLDVGFERASMDVIAERAGTTKRTLYAHFESKERLFLAVLDLVRDLMGERLRTPADDAVDPMQALAMFCLRFRGILMWGPTIRTCRLGIAEAKRLPEGADGFHHTLFGMAGLRIETFLRERLGVDRGLACGLADDLLSHVIRPEFVRALFGACAVPEEWSEPDTADLVPELAWVRSVLGGPAC